MRALSCTRPEANAGECQFNLVSHKAGPLEILMVIVDHPDNQ